jgi:cytochrome c biogenesis protein CcmG, thiol:disulfide interchange protein DsbE
MTQMRGWTIALSVVMTLGFGTALALKIRPELDLVGAGSRAPQFRAVDLRTGRPVSLDHYRGQVILLNVWATWCPPCRVEMPSMERIQQRLGGTDFDVVAVSIDEADSSVVRQFAQAMGVTFDILHDRAGAIQRLYQTSGVPESFVINRDGVIVKKVIGPAEWDGPVNETLIRKLIDAH